MLTFGKECEGTQSGSWFPLRPLFAGTWEQTERDLYHQLDELHAELSFPADLGFSQVRIVAEYPSEGFGIIRLTPQCHGFLPDLELFPSTTEGGVEFEHRLPMDSISQVLQKVSDDGESTTHSENDEPGRDDEVWDRLPTWMKTLDGLKRKAKQGSRK